MKDGDMSRPAAVIITLSTVSMIIAAILFLAGAGLSQSIKIDQDDIQFTGKVGVVDLDPDFGTILTIIIESDRELNIEISLLREINDKEILNEEGSTPMRLTERIPEGGIYQLTLTLITPDADPDDAEISISWTGLDSMITVILSFILILSAIPLLITGCVVFFMDLNRKDRYLKRRKGRNFQ